MSKVRQMENGVIWCNERVVIVPGNWDLLCDMELQTGEGFRITEKGKTDKNEDPGYYSIHSPLYGTDWGDDKAFEDRWSCKCGKYIGRYYADKDFVCEDCGEPVKKIGVNMKKKGWIVLDRNHLIQPHMYLKLAQFIGRKPFEDMLEFKSSLEPTDKPLSPFSKIGMISFEERFDEIMDYYLKKNKKMEQYIFLMAQRKEIFIRSIPVYTIHLRHFTIKDGKVKYTPDDTLFKRLFTNHLLLNNDFALARRATDGNIRKKGVDYLRKENILFRMQKDILKLWDFSFNAIDGKTGTINGQLAAGRMNYTARNVIVPDPTLRMDEIDIGYTTALELMKAELLDFMHRMYHINYRQAKDLWDEATMVYSPKIHKILNHMINIKPRYVSIYRNPSINYGSRMVMRIRKINEGIDDNCLSLSPQVLVKPNADFDGDILALIFHKMDDLSEEFYRRLNPRSNFSISRNDGRFDNDSNLIKDQAVILYSFLNM